MLNLLECLTETDRELIESYIDFYGVDKYYYIGTDKYLKPWADSKKRLYHLLGGTLQYKFPINLEKSKEILSLQMKELCVNSSLYNDFLGFAISVENAGIYENKYSECINYTLVANLFNIIFSAIKDLKDNISSDITINAETVISYNATPEIIANIDSNFKPVKIAKGTKVMRALAKMLNYFKVSKKVLEAFENFRINHSMVLNDKYFKGDGVISIHPLDFMTMSDNNSNWSSCMSWVSNGCYHLGTVEMMNSNNVVCCYLESKEPYYFGKGDEKNNKKYVWNNKKFRQLFYITNEIIVGGKSYPYQSTDLTTVFLTEIRKLAEDNLNRTYTYGPELYKDMIHIDTFNQMEQNKYWANKAHPGFKHNIIFETNAMYNDMLNASFFNYLCVRNKVNRTKVISYSGKAPCLCCGNDAKRFCYDDDYYEDGTDEYNSRYDAHHLVCEDCFSAYSCSSCDKVRKKEEYIIKERHSSYSDETSLCKNCFAEYIDTCPCCGSYIHKQKNFSIQTYNFIFMLDSQVVNPLLSDFNEVYVVDGCYECVGKKSVELQTRSMDESKADKFLRLINKNHTDFYYWIHYFAGSTEEAKYLIENCKVEIPRKDD